MAALLYFVAFPLVIAAVALAAGGNIGFLVPALAVQPGATLLLAVAASLVITLPVLLLGTLRRAG